MVTTETDVNGRWGSTAPWKDLVVVVAVVVVDVRVDVVVVVVVEDARVLSMATVFSGITFTNSTGQYMDGHQKIIEVT